MTPPVDPRWLGSKLRAKLWREINSAGLGGLINRRLLLIVLRRRRKKPPRRSAAALNQFHGPFITGEIKPIFSFQFFTIIGPLLSHLSGCALAGDKDTSVYELWRAAALRGAVLSSSLLQPVAQTIPPPSPHSLLQCAPGEAREIRPRQPRTGPRPTTADHCRTTLQILELDSFQHKDQQFRKRFLFIL